MKGLVIGRIVHYVTTNSKETCAAIVTGVVDQDAGTVNVMVFSDLAGNAVQARNKPFSENSEPGTWHWPPRNEG